MNPIEMQFNIIYTPGTVKYLQIFLLSLLKWLKCSFRLVANGCSPEDVHLLQLLCQTNPRLEFLSLPFVGMVEHAVALNYLQSLERSEYFCFMDSDIFATGDFLSEILPNLDHSTAVFSGYPLFVNRARQIYRNEIAQMTGRFCRTDQGVCLGSTYFAIYNNRRLSQVIKDSGLGFELRKWKDTPDAFRDILEGMNLKPKLFDTAKVLNLMMVIRGDRTVFVDSHFLRHIGGFSIPTSGHGKTVHGKDRVKRIFRRLASKLFGLWRRFNVWLMERTGLHIQTIFPKSPSQQALTETRTEIRADMQRRGQIRSFFYHLLQALLENQQIPDIPQMNVPEVQRRMDLVTKEIHALYDEFSGRLV